MCMHMCVYACVHACIHVLVQLQLQGIQCIILVSMDTHKCTHMEVCMHTHIKKSHFNDLKI